MERDYPIGPNVQKEKCSIFMDRSECKVKILIFLFGFGRLCSLQGRCPDNPLKRHLYLQPLKTITQSLDFFIFFVVTLSALSRAKTSTISRTHNPKSPIQRRKKKIISVIFIVHISHNKTRVQLNSSWL